MHTRALAKESTLAAAIARMGNLTMLGAWIVVVIDGVKVLVSACLGSCFVERGY